MVGGHRWRGHRGDGALGNHRPLSLGIVGLGWIGSRYVAAAERLPADVALAGLVDENPDVLRQYASTNRLLGSYQAMADSGPLDGVVICTPPASHQEVAEFFLDRRVSVLCEKPFALTVPSAESMSNHASAAGVFVAVATKYRCLEEVARARDLVMSGKLGDVISFEIVFTSKNDMRGRWHTNSDISGGGIFVDNGSHAVDVAQYLFGPVQDIMVVEYPRTQGLPVEDTAQAILRTASGVVGSSFMSWSIDRANDFYLSVHGTTGDVRVGWDRSEYRLAPAQEWTAFGERYDVVHALANQLSNFSDALRGTASPVSSADDAVNDVAAIVAGCRSIQTHSWETTRSAHG